MTDREARFQSGLYPRFSPRLGPDRWEHDNTLFTAVLMVTSDNVVVGCVVSSLLSCGVFTDRFKPETCLSDMLALTRSMFTSS